MTALSFVLMNSAVPELTEVLLERPQLKLRAKNARAPLTVNMSTARVQINEGDIDLKRCWPLQQTLVKQLMRNKPTHLKRSLLAG